MELYIKVFIVSIRKQSSSYLLPCSFLEYNPFYYLPNASLYPDPPFSYSLDPFSDLFPATSPCSSPSASSLSVYHWRAHEIVTVPPDSLSTPAPPADETPFRYPLRVFVITDLLIFMILLLIISPIHKQFLVVLYSYTKSLSYKEASSLAHWQTVMVEELAALHKTHSFS